PEPMSEDGADSALASSRSHYLWAPGRIATGERLKWTFNRSFPHFACFEGEFVSPREAGLGLQGGALEDVALRDLHRVETEDAHRLREDQPAGDDRRRPLGMKPGHPAPLLQGEHGELVKDALARGVREAMAMDAVAVVGL